MHHPRRSIIGVGAAGLVLVLISCGGGGTSFSPPPINLSVSVNNTTVLVPPNGTAVNIPVTIVAPTETATFTISGLPAGVSDNYKESESNPSGLLTLVANTSTVPGTYMPIITVGSSGQTASVVFTLVISEPPKPGSARSRIEEPTSYNKSSGPEESARERPLAIESRRACPELVERGRLNLAQDAVLGWRAPRKSPAGTTEKVSDMGTF
jgi:hypothetical protein